MIISHIIGGLGNQMFQYAMGRALALRRNADFNIDTSAFKTYPLHSYGLHHLAIAASVATDAEVRALRGRKFNSRFGTLIQHFVKEKPSYVHEKVFTFDPAMQTLGDKVYLEGYWQSEKYFADVAETIRKEFQVSHEPDAENAELLQRIAATNSIVVHVRRGDYVTNTTTNKFHGTTPIDYYQQAVARMQTSVDKPELFIFSDDPQWVKDNLHFSCPSTYVTHNDASTSYEDLRLMAHCKHHIIANSTFSWWGAWLAEHPVQRVISPKLWFHSNQDSSDLIPTRWERM